MSERRENLAVTLVKPSVALTVNPRGDETVTIKGRYIYGRNIDITSMQLTMEAAEDLRDLLNMVIAYASE